MLGGHLWTFFEAAAWASRRTLDCVHITLADDRTAAEGPPYPQAGDVTKGADVASRIRCDLMLNRVDPTGEGATALKEALAQQRLSSFATNGRGIIPRERWIGLNFHDSPPLVQGLLLGGDRPFWAECLIEQSAAVALWPETIVTVVTLVPISSARRSGGGRKKPAWYPELDGLVKARVKRRKQLSLQGRSPGVWPKAEMWANQLAEFNQGEVPKADTVSRHVAELRRNYEDE